MDVDPFTTDNFQLRRVEFVPAQRVDASPVPKGVDIIVLNGVLPDTDKPQLNTEAIKPKMHQRELFREQDVLLHWKTVQKTGAGLQNLGNTCFMNSVLQCLTHTPPLAEALLAGKQLGSSKHFDPLRLTQQQVINSLQNRHNHSVAPTAHAKSLRQISKSFRLGRQEDAHEYLVALLDAMHESYLNMCRPRPSPELSKTSMIYRIFAGKIRSQVKCTECGHESNTYDTFLDLSLEINRASDLQRALQRFTGTEYLDGANKYICPKQKRKVRAAKCMTVEEAPAVLVVQLKRFEFSMFGHKINKKVDFDTELDLRPYMSNRRRDPQPYTLYGVLVHAGHSVHSGHYYAYVKGPNGLWHQLDDNHVSQVSERVVLAQKAYILFYIKNPANGHTHVSPAKASKQVGQGSAISPAPQAKDQPAGPTSPQAPAHQTSSPSAQPVAQSATQPATQHGKQHMHGAADKSASVVSASDIPVAFGQPPAADLMKASVDKAAARSTAQASRKDVATAEDQHQTVGPTMPAQAQLQPAGSRGAEQQTGHSNSAEGTAVPTQANVRADPDARLVHSLQDKLGRPAGNTQPAGQLQLTRPGQKRKSEGLPGQQPLAQAQQGLAAAAAAADQPGTSHGATEHVDTNQKAKRRNRAQQTAAADAALPTGVAANAALAPQVDVAADQDGTSQKAKRRRKLRHDVSAGDGVDPPQAAAGAAPADGISPEVAMASSSQRRAAGSIMYSSPHQEWRGRSWNRFNLHRNIHHARQLLLAEQVQSLTHAPRVQQHRSSTASCTKLTSNSPTTSPAVWLASNSPSGTLAARPAGRSPSGAAPAGAAAGQPLPDAAVPLSHASVSLPQLQQRPAGTAQTGQGTAQTGQGPAKSQTDKGFARSQPDIGASAPDAAVSGNGVTGIIVNGQATGNQKLSAAGQHAAGIQQPDEPLHGLLNGHSDRANHRADESEQATQPGQAQNGISGKLQQSVHEQQADRHGQNGTQAKLVTRPASIKDLQNGLLQPLGTWDDANPALVKQAKALSRESGPKRRHKVDVWDADYDKGKVKKVKSKRGGLDAWQQGTNVFLKASRGGKRHQFGGKRKNQRQQKEHAQ